MIRLAVSGDKVKWSEIGSRLRGATIDTICDFSVDPAPPDGCDAVLFIGSGRLPSEQVERCLSARKHVLLVVESWLSMDMLEVLSAAALESQVQFAVVNPERFLPSRQLIRQQLDDGKLGEPGLVRMHRWEPVNSENARVSTELPPRLLRDLELALSMMGKSPDTVYAIKPMQNDHDISSGRCVLVHLGFSGGGMALIDYADFLPPGDDYLSLSVIGSLGAAYADDHQNMQLVYRGGHPQSVRVEERGRPLVPLVQEFVDGLGASRDFSGRTEAWLGVLAVAENVRRSLITRHVMNREGC